MPVVLFSAWITCSATSLPPSPPDPVPVLEHFFVYSHSYTLLILREPSIWSFITSAPSLTRPAGSGGAGRDSPQDCCERRVPGPALELQLGRRPFRVKDEPHRPQVKANLPHIRACLQEALLGGMQCVMGWVRSRAHKSGNEATRSRNATF